MIKAAKWGTAGGLVLVLIGVAVFIFAYNKIDIPDPNEDFQTQSSYVYWKDGKSELGRFQEQNRTSLSYDDMPQNIKDAVVAAENESFWTDRGIDPKGIMRAMFNNAKSSSIQGGASTITQQYIKTLYLTSEQSYKRKVKEAILALKMHNQMSKPEILEGYLNTIYFGRGAYGIEEASKAFFDKPAKDMNLKEAAVLASVLNNPDGSLDPASGKENKARLKERYEYTLRRMAEMDEPAITAARAEKASKRLPTFPKMAASDRLANQKGHALTLVKQELQRLGFDETAIDAQGLRITTTLNRKVMQAAEQAVLQERPDNVKEKNLHVGVASVQPGTGALRGFYGGHDYLDSQINWAMTGGMAGSTIKPAAAAAALEAGFELKDIFQGDSPYEYPSGEQVVNSGEAAGIVDGHDYGDVTMIQAMEDSVNTAFIDMTEGIGSDGNEQIYDIGTMMGIAPMKGDQEYKDYAGLPAKTPDWDPNDSRISLGKAVVSPINMANMYATIANGGERHDVHIVSKVTDKSGKVLYDHEKHKNPVQAIPEDIAADVSYTLQKTADDGTGSKNASSYALGRPAAGKTGTATKENGEDGTDVSSAWYAGYTPQLATAVTYVRGDGNDPIDGWLDSYYGADYPAATFAETMRRALDGEPVEEFPEPAWVTGEAPSEGHEPPPPEPPEDEDDDKHKPEEPEPSIPFPSDSFTVPTEPPDDGNNGGGKPTKPTEEPSDEWTTEQQQDEPFLGRATPAWAVRSDPLGLVAQSLAFWIS